MTRYKALRAATLQHRLAFLVGDSVLYGGASAVSKLLALFTVPVLTRILSRSQFGAMDVLSIWSTLIAVAATLGQDSAVARFFYETEDDEERRELISEALFVEVGLAVVLIGSFWLAGPWFLTKVLSMSSEHSAYRAMLLGVPGLIVLSFFRNLAKWMFDRWRFIALSLGASATVIALTIILVVRTRLGVAAVFYAQLVGNTIFGGAAVIAAREWLRWPRRWSWTRSLLQFGIPYMAVAVVACSLPALDRAFITHRLSLDAVGIYAVGFKLASLVLFPVLAFQTAWGPFSLAIYKEPNAIDTYNRVLVLYTVCMSLMIIVLVSTAEPLLLVIASRKYMVSRSVVLPLALAFIVESIGWILGIGIDLAKKTYWNAISYGFGIAGAAASIAALIRPFGLLGVALGVLVGRTLQTIAYSWFAHRLYPMRFHWTRAGLVLVSAAFLCLLMHVVPTTSTAADIVVRIAIVSVAVIIAWRAFLAPSERGRIWGAVRQRLAFPRP